MIVETVQYMNVELVFYIYEGKVQGYNKIVKSETHVTGGGGDIETGYFSGKVSGKIKPLSSSTSHVYISEFAVVEEDGTEISLRLNNLKLILRNDLPIIVWIEEKTNRVYKIINANSGSFVIVNDISSIFKRTNYYFKSYIRNNSVPKYIWWSTLLICFFYTAWMLIELFTHRFDIITFIVGLVFLLPPYILYKLVKRVLKWQLRRGFSVQMP